MHVYYCSLLVTVYSEAQQTRVVNWDGHAASPPCTPTLLIRTRWIISYRQNGRWE